MLLVSSIQTTQYRLARHYLNKLRAADGAYRQGQSSIVYGITLFDQEWEQIQHWQSWAAKQKASDEASAQLCKEFPLAGLELLPNRCNPAEHAVWINAALESAHQLQDREAAATLYYELAMIYYRLGALERVEHLANQLLNLGEEAGDLLSIERAVFLLGVFADDRGQYVAAEHYYQRALQLSTELSSDNEMARALNGLGAIAFYRGDYEKAYSYLLRQLELVEATGNKNKICNALISLGRILIGLKEYKKAEEYLQQAMTMCRLLGYRRLLGVGLLNLGSAAAQQNQWEAARSYLEEGIQAVRSTDTQRQVIRGLAMLGDTYMRLGNLPESLAHLQEGLCRARDAGLPRHICDLQRNLTNTYLAMKDHEAARNALHESLTLAHNLGSYPQKVAGVLSAIAYVQHLALYEQAALWAGSIWDDPVLDQHVFQPICQEIAVSLGDEVFQRTLAQGKALSLSDAVTEILEFLIAV